MGDRGSTGSRWTVPLLGAAAGVVMADPNVAGTALVEATRGLGMPATWIPVAASVESYVTAATVVSTGLLADRIGRRRVLMGALGLLAAAELLAAASWAPLVYIVARALTGVAVGAVFGSAFAYVRSVVAAERLGAALGVFGAVGTVVMMVTSVAGGSVTSLGWRLGFATVAALAVIVLSFAAGRLPAVPRVGAGPVDVTGQILLALGVVLPLLALGRAGSLGAQPWLPFLVGAACLTAFVWVEHRGTAPFFPLEVFRDRRYLGAVVMGLSFNAAMAVLLLQLANLWQYLNHWSAWQVSLGSMPAFLAGMLASLAAGRRLSAGVSPRSIAGVGYALMVAGFVVLATFRQGASVLPFLVALLLVGMGTQAVNVPYGALIVQVAPPASYGPVTSSRTTVGQIGYAIGLAGATVLIDRLTTIATVDGLAAAGISPTRTAEALSVVTMYIEHGTTAVTEEARQVLAVAAEAYAGAFAAAMAIVAVLLAVLGVLMWWLLRPDRSG